MGTESGIPDYRRYMFIAVSVMKLYCQPSHYCQYSKMQNSYFMAVLMVHTVRVSNHLLIKVACILFIPRIRKLKELQV